jgi:hypothetical protein
MCHSNLAVEQQRALYASCLDHKSLKESSSLSIRAIDHLRTSRSLEGLGKPELLS